MEEWSYTSTHPLGHTGPVKRSLYLYMYIAFAGLDNKLYKMHGTYINILYVLFWRTLFSFNSYELFELAATDCTAATRNVVTHPLKERWPVLSIYTLLVGILATGSPSVSTGCGQCCNKGGGVSVTPTSPPPPPPFSFLTTPPPPSDSLIPTTPRKFVEAVRLHPVQKSREIRQV